MKQNSLEKLNSHEKLIFQFADADKTEIRFALSNAVMNYFNKFCDESNLNLFH